MNNKPFKQLKGTRQQGFESLDKMALMALLIAASTSILSISKRSL